METAETTRIPIPDWYATPSYGYSLFVSDADGSIGPESEIELTQEEFIACKREVARMRGLPTDPKLFTTVSLHQNGEKDIICPPPAFVDEV